MVDNASSFLTPKNISLQNLHNLTTDQTLVKFMRKHFLVIMNFGWALAAIYVFIHDPVIAFSP